ncbi:MAG: UDP-N-acetylmuramoyl-L-alanyl-D-glutamate--2,6-diaminopimelate ligase [Candidatus Dadabacteria bacterium]|nr:UDP-N-acetylmuramoyl-L-alanyl-D-glutamate--2,6-diaminopimelate ligase [Candidatus Dadabacteria bacterium]MYI73282.1 UDP-N-acetylmuramoyl-L-alanyl-D-glutamate--2,6-diaminopimelate ligase [Candidatus Dadabacteria bacterium]
MRLADVLRNAGIEAITGSKNPGDTEITGITLNSQNVEPGSLFIAIRGKVTDGHNYVASAVEKGAVALLLEEISAEIPDLGVPFAKTSDSRAAASIVASNFHGHPSLAMKVVGVTGTNGKTTVSHMIEAGWKADGVNTGLLGTIENRYMGKTEPASLTTPDPIAFMSMLREMKDAGVTNVTVEVSSHALDLKRVDGCHFDAAIFTNLTQDHLDYHKTLEDYFRAKERLFSEILEKSAKKEVFSIINADDPFANRISASKKGLKITFSTEKKDSVVFAENFTLDSGGIKATLATPWGKVELDSKLMGKHNLYNMMAAAGTLLSLGSSPATTGRALSELRRIPGRLEKIESSLGIDVFVDYAHTPDALENVLACLKPFCAQRLITVVGCGGDRDRGKRPLMAAVGRRYSDMLIVTSDNPRTEDPERIIEDMTEGVEPQDPGVVVITEREEAIKNAVDKAVPGDTVLIAGKGHENYQIIGTEKIHFDDREIAEKYLEARERRGL